MYPNLAIWTLHELADDMKSELPLATPVLKTQTYVGDILSGSRSLPQVCDSLSEVIQFLKTAGFSIKKIRTNHPKD